MIGAQRDFRLVGCDQSLQKASFDIRQRALTNDFNRFPRKNGQICENKSIHTVNGFPQGILGTHAALDELTDHDRHQKGDTADDPRQRDDGAPQPDAQSLKYNAKRNRRRKDDLVGNRSRRIAL